MHAGLLQTKLAQFHLLANLSHPGGKQIEEAFDGKPERKGGKAIAQRRGEVTQAW